MKTDIETVRDRFFGGEVCRDFYAEILGPNWLIKDLGIAPGRPCCFASAPGAGKTFAVQSLAVAVALGRPVWGKFECRQAPVLHLDLELGGASIPMRYQSVLRGAGSPDVTGKLVSVAMPGISLESPEQDWIEIADGFGLVVVDSLRGASDSSENDSNVQLGLKKLAYVSGKTGASFILIHHSGRPRGRKSAPIVDDLSPLRGSSAIGASVSSCYSVWAMGAEEDSPRLLTRAKRHELTDGAQVKRVTLQQYKENGGVVFLAKDEPGEAESSTSLEAEIKKVVGQQPDLTESKIKFALRSAKVKFGNEAFTATLTAMVRSGELSMVQHKQAKTFRIGGQS